MYASEDHHHPANPRVPHLRPVQVAAKEEDEERRFELDPGRLYQHRKMSFHQSLPGSIVDIQETIARGIKNKRPTSKIMAAKSGSSGRRKTVAAASTSKEDRERMWRY